MTINEWIRYGEKQGYLDQARSAAINQARIAELQDLNDWLVREPMTRKRLPQLFKYTYDRLTELRHKP